MARILMVLDHAFPPDLRVENELFTLRDSGFEVGILAIGPDKRPANELTDGIRIFRSRISAGKRNRMRGLAAVLPLMDRFLDQEVRTIHSEWPFDALHAHDLYLLGAALRIGRQLEVKVIGDLHENWPAALKDYAWSKKFPARLFNHPDRWDRLETAWVREADGVIVVIDEMADRIRSKGVRPGRLIVLPNTVHIDRFDRLGIDSKVAASLDGENTILYTGGMDAHRGIESAIRAMVIVRGVHSSARLVLVGDGAVRSELEELSERLGVASSVEFMGWKPQESIPSYIMGATVGLIPHLKTEHTDHTIPHKLFHYMHLGVPVVASNCAPIERIVRDTDSGKVFEAGNEEQLAHALIQLLSSTEERQRLGKNGRKAVADTYNWSSTSEDFGRRYLEWIG